MYLKLFGLDRNPFKNAPGSTSFYSSVNHKRILDGLLHGLREKVGLHLILGDNGTGKTTLCRFVQLAYGHEFVMGYLGNPFVSDQEFLRHVLAEYGLAVPEPPTPTAMLDTFGAYLRQQAGRDKIVVLFVDEAHHLSQAIFDLLLVLANMQTGGVPLVQLVLCGLPELLDVLGRPALKSLNQRIGSRSTIQPLSLDDTAKYVRHRLDAAGSKDLSLFSPEVIKAIWKATGGKPRLINHLARLCLETAATDESVAITPATVRQALADPAYATLFDGDAPMRTMSGPGRLAPSPWLGLAAAVALLVIGGLGWKLLDRTHAPAPEQPPAPTAQMPAAPSPVAQAPVSPAPPATSAPTPTLAPAPTAPAAPATPAPTADGSQQQLEVMKSAMEAVKTAAESLKAMAETSRTPTAVIPLHPDQPFDTPLIPNNEPESGLRHRPVVPAPAPPRKAPAVKEQDLVAPPALARPTTPTPAPVAPAPAKAAGAVPQKFESVRVNAIAWHDDPGRRMVVLDDQILRQGDTIRGATVDAIAQNHVVLREKNETFVLNLSEAR